MERSKLQYLLSDTRTTDRLIASCAPSCAFYDLKTQGCRINNQPVVINARCGFNLPFEAVQNSAILEKDIQK